MGLREDKAERMQKLLAGYDQSLESQEVYCERIGLGLSCFRYWRRKIQQAKPAGFVRVSAASVRGGLVAVEIVYPNGVRVTVGSGVDAATLADFIRLW